MLVIVRAAANKARHHPRQFPSRHASLSGALQIGGVSPKERDVSTPKLVVYPKRGHESAGIHHIAIRFFVRLQISGFMNVAPTSITCGTQPSRKDADVSRMSSQVPCFRQRCGGGAHLSHLVEILRFSVEPCRHNHSKYSRERPRPPIGHQFL